MIIQIEGVPEFNFSQVGTIEFTKRLGRYCMDFGWIDSIIEEHNSSTVVLNSIPIFFEDREARKYAYLKIMHARAKGFGIFKCTRSELITPINVSIKHQLPKL